MGILWSMNEIMNEAQNEAQNEHMRKKKYRDAIYTAAAAAGVAAPLYPTIHAYVMFLMEKNQELNLISRKLEPETVIQDHLFDCLLGWTYFKTYPVITDLGSGGGLPGLLLAILFPQKQIFLIDKSPKKNIFLKQAVAHLNLTNVQLKMGLVTDQTILQGVITSRAFKPIAPTLEMTQPFFKAGGHYLLYKGRETKIKEELREAAQKFRFEAAIYKITRMEEKERHLVLISMRV